MSSNDIVVAVEIFGEFLEVIFHNILFARKLYPEVIFVRKKKYGIIVYQCIQPDINSYIEHCLKAITFHAKKSQLRRVLFCLQDDKIVLEKFVFELFHLHGTLEGDTLLVRLEQNLRSFMLKLFSSLSYVRELPESTTFAIKLETTCYSSLEFNQTPAFEDFPWIELDSHEVKVESSEIVPLDTINSKFLKFEIYIEQ